MPRMIAISEKDLEHLLNCMCNQKYIHEMKSADAESGQKVIDRAYREAMNLLMNQYRMAR